MNPGGRGRRASTSLIFIVILVAGLGPAQAPAQAPAPAVTSTGDLEALLAAPVSPGTLALMLPFAARPEVVARWREALTAADASSRATAARMVHVSAARWLVPALLQAIAREDDENALIEQLLATVVLGDAGPTALAARHAIARGGRAAALFGAAVLAARPDQFRALLPELAPALPEEMLGVLIAQASTVTAPEAQAGLATVAMTRGQRAWRTLLTENDRLRRPLPGPWVEAALARADAALRTDLAWALVRSRVLDRRDGQAWLRKWPDASDQSAEEGYALTLAQRRVGLARADGRPWIVEASDQEVAAIAWRLDFSWDEVSKAERAVIEKRAGVKPPGPAALSEDDQYRGGFGLREIFGSTVTRTMGPFPVGLVDSLIAVSGCDAPAGLVGAMVSYRPDRRPAKVDLMAGGLSPACTSVLRALATSSVLMPDDAVDARPHLLLTRLEAERPGCIGEYAPSLVRYLSAATLSRADTIDMPTLRGRGRLDVPDAARQRRIQGVILLDMLLSATGCVCDVRVTRAIPILDIAAVDYVLKWELSPARRNGEPVPAWVGHVVNFAY